MNRFWRRVLNGGALVLIVTAAALAAWPLGLPDGASADAVVLGTSNPAPAPSGAVIPPPGDTLTEAIVRGNLFSASRRAPTTRYVAPGQLPDPATLSAMDTGDTVPAESDPAFPQLLGIVSQDGVLFGMLQVRDSVPPRLVRAGDVVDGVRVRRVTKHLMVLSTANGTRTVRLSREAASDSTGMLP